MNRKNIFLGSIREPSYINFYTNKKHIECVFSFVPPAGLEPATICLRGNCSTDWAMGALNILQNHSTTFIVFFQ